MQKEQIETLVIGGGQAGLAMSYHLSRRGCEHMVLERARVAERWRSERWDSLRFQSPNWNIHLPGYALETQDPEAFSPRDDVVDFIDRYASVIRAPLRLGTEATALGQRPDARRLIVRTPAGTIEARNVVLATGPFQRPQAAPFVAGCELEIHSSQYRGPQQIPPGAVLIVGSGNSGCQIAEELCGVGRRVYLSVGRHRRVPRRYRGKDYFWWYIKLGDADTTCEQHRGGARPSILITGVNGGHDVDLRRLAADGVVLLGRIAGCDGGRLVIVPDLAETLGRGEAALDEFRSRADKYALLNRCSLAAPEIPEVLPEPRECANPHRALDLRDAKIGTVIWANGYRYDYDWVNLPDFADGKDSNSAPLHSRGVTNVPGLFVLGLPWLHKLKSSFLHGVGEDAEHLAEQISRRG